jgi:Tol biopolymer transport system component
MSTSRRIGLVLAGLLALGAAADTAQATAPGRNGLITFRRYLDPGRSVGAIFTVAPDGSRERQVTSPPPGYSDDSPDYAADGRLIALERCSPDLCRIYTVRPDGSRLRAITPTCPPGELPPACSDNFSPAISPDVRQVAFSHAFGKIVDDQIDHVGIYRMPIGGGRVHRVTLPPTRAAEDRGVQWSPDGRRLVFIRTNYAAQPTGRQAIFVVNADGRGLHRLTPWDMDAGDGPDWAPDGSRILFRSPDHDDFLHSQLYTVRPDGTGLEQITHVPDGMKLYSASYSPDGRFITFGMQGLGGLPDIYRMNADGTGVAPVAQTAAYDSAPDWGGVRHP